MFATSTIYLIWVTGLDSKEGKPTNEEYIQESQGSFKLAKNPSPIAFKTMLLINPKHMLGICDI